MAKFLNKKEQVIDFQLSRYGKHLLSVGRFKPVYYAFLDDNILYDGSYAGLSQSQNSIKPRIKNNTAYLEPTLNFGAPGDRAAELLTQNSTDYYYEHNITPTMKNPSENIRKNIKIIGDAYLEGNKNSYPSWKVVMLQADISGSQSKDTYNSIDIPQINITASYTKKVVPLERNIDPKNVRQLIDSVGTFSDNTQIKLIMNDPVIYLEEVNTQLLTENFDIEVFEVTTNGGLYSGISGAIQDEYVRKYFEPKKQQIVNGFMVSEKAPIRGNPAEPRFFGLTETISNTSSVEYYFDFALDHQVDKDTACKGAHTFNRSSYYVDLDFDCEIEEEDTIVYADIYGELTEPEICQ